MLARLQPPRTRPRASGQNLISGKWLGLECKSRRNTAALIPRQIRILHEAMQLCLLFGFWARAGASRR